jgi:acetylornithine deacetylase/succinyl-diaminopimelate desuccinylase-like protein
MIIAAAAANESVGLKGDIIVACMMAEMAGNVGVQEMLKTGVKADMAIVPEATNLEIEPVNVGTIIGKIRVEGTSSKERYASMYSNAIERACKLIDAFGPTYKPIPPSGWLTFEPDHLLPGYPRIASAAIECPLYSKLCTVTYRFTTVPGQTDKTVRKDLDGLIGKLRAEDPDFRAQIETMERVTPPIKTSLEEPIVKSLAKWQEYMTKKEPAIGAVVRLGTITDGGLLSAAGMKAIVYGPAMADPWPMVDERVRIGDVIIAAKVMALAAAELCG